MPGDQQPATIGPYQLLKRIGSGGMGQVYIALDDGATVAVKTVHQHLIERSGIRQRLTREVETMRRVRHPRVAEVLHHDLDHDPPYLVTRYAQGLSLERAVDVRGPLAEDGLLRLLLGSADGLAAIHAVQVVHRDIKPGNIMLDHGDPMIIDFGIAHGVDATRLTYLDGPRAGTPRYLAPELWQGLTAGPPSDVFAWAATMAYAATGRDAFAAETAEGARLRIVEGEPDLAGVPDSLAGLLRKAMAKDPADRPAAADLRGRIVQTADLATMHFLPPEKKARPEPVAGGEVRARAVIGLVDVIVGSSRDLMLAEPVPRLVRFRVPTGARSGTEVRVPGEGLPGRRGGAPGDLVVTLEVSDHPDFERRGDDLHGVLSIDSELARTGGGVVVDAPDGRIDLRVPAGMRTGQTRQVPGRGVPGRSGRRGDLFLRVEVKPSAKAQASLEALERVRASAQRNVEAITEHHRRGAPRGAEVEVGQAESNARQAVAHARLLAGTEFEEQAAETVDAVQELAEEAVRLHRRLGPQPVDGEDIEQEIRLTLAELFEATVKSVAAGGRQVQARIPAGAASGTRLRYEGMGGRGRHGGADGDLVLLVNVQEDPDVRRVGDDLHGELTISARLAERGAEMPVPHPERSIIVTVPPGTVDGAVLRVSGMGLPAADGAGRGDLILLTTVLPEPSGAQAPPVSDGPRPETAAAVPQGRGAGFLAGAVWCGGILLVAGTFSLPFVDGRRNLQDTATTGTVPVEYSENCLMFGCKGPKSRGQSFLRYTLTPATARAATTFKITGWGTRYLHVLPRIDGSDGCGPSATVRYTITPERATGGTGTPFTGTLSPARRQAKIEYGRLGTPDRVRVQLDLRGAAAPCTMRVALQDPYVHRLPSWLRFFAMNTAG